MKQIAITLSALLIITAAITGCKEDLPPEIDFTNINTNISMSINGNIIIGYSNTYQLGFNDQKKEFRVHNDDFSKYFVITCSSMPSQVDENIDATLVYTDADGNAVTVAGKFKVTQIDDDERLIWLWNSDKQIGVVVKELK